VALVIVGYGIVISCPEADSQTAGPFIDLSVFSPTVVSKTTSLAQQASTLSV
jgi:hypothetical protein